MSSSVSIKAVAVRLCTGLALWGTLATVLAGAAGILEATGTIPRSPRYTTGDIAAFMPTTRGPFTFPSPYNTQGIRLTDSTDCTSAQDCVWYVGYSYWPNINAHSLNPTTLYVMLGLEWNRGGVGPTIFSVDKSTLAVTKIGPLFTSSDSLRFQTGQGWYFSMNPANPTRLYMGLAAPSTTFSYIDILTKSITQVFSIVAQFGANRGICQMNSNWNDTVHAGTLVDTAAPSGGGASCGNLSAAARLGCFAYETTNATWHWFPEQGGKDFNECNIDREGRVVISLEDSGAGAEPTYNRFFEIKNIDTPDKETKVTGTANTLGHFDTGYGYAVGADNYNAQPNASIVWYLNPPLLGPLVHYNHPGSGAWEIVELNHVSHTNSVRFRDLARQYACGSDANNYTAVRNEIVCIPLNGVLQQLVIAPVMTDFTNFGCCDDYSRRPKGNLDVTGEWFIWTSNLLSNRLDAFLVKIPKQTLFPSTNGF